MESSEEKSSQSTAAAEVEAPPGETPFEERILNMEPSAGREISDEEYQRLVEMYDESMKNLSEGEIVRGRVIGVTGNSVIVDVGYKSEGLIPKEEFTDHEGKLTVGVGDQVDVLLEKTEDVEGHVLLSRQKAERMQRWNEIENAYNASSIIRGRIIDRIKGGLTVDVGLRAFLPGSLVDIKPVKNLESLRGQILEFKVINLDRRRNNIVLSRKAVLEKELEKKKAETLTKLKEGARLPGIVKNITDYGVFIDLGGIDGLLHITDISWGRVNHPSEHFSVGDEVEVVVLKFDPETERVSLGFKQKFEDPWTLVDKKYPVGSRVHGKVVSIVDYGAFVELEEGVEGLIHVSEMSWTKKVVNPSKILSVGQELEAIVSELDMQQRRISLSIRQIERNPWEELTDSHPVGSIIEGKVRNLTEFGAFVEITEGIDGLIHVSDMSWTKRIKHPSEVLKKGDTVKARITNIDTDNQRVSLSIKEFMPNEWDDFVAEHSVGDAVEGRVVNVTDFGLFIDIYQGLEGLAHISEIDVPPGAKLDDHFEVGDWVRARILRIEGDEHKVGLTMRGVVQPTADEIEELEARAKASAGGDKATREAAKEGVVVETAEAAAAAEEAEGGEGDEEEEAG
ncbi:MAG TPA: 30S ribosomal protein S1 [Thermoanaerobaculia bacterium]|nr:30S ribosomal protein S1 [Thermoanaerobaculia bacterium]